MEIKFCQYCGGKTENKTPAGDEHLRSVCNSCKAIHYQNPKIINGVIIEHQNQILLAKRAIEPCYGMWTIPAGFMELNETTQAGAIRECREETNANLKNVELFGVYNIIPTSQVYIMFRAELDGVEFSPTEESLEVKLFDPDEIPWEEIAFPCVTEALKRFVNEMNSKNYSIKLEDIKDSYKGATISGYFDD